MGYKLWWHDRGEPRREVLSYWVDIIRGIEEKEQNPAGFWRFFLSERDVYETRHYGKTRRRPRKRRLPESMFVWMGRIEWDARLTRREQQVLVLLAHQCSNEEMADLLSVARRTVEYYLNGARRKLGLALRSALADWVVQRMRAWERAEARLAAANERESEMKHE